VELPYKIINILSTYSHLEISFPFDMRNSLMMLPLVALSAAEGISVYNGKSDGLSQHTIYMPNMTSKVPLMVWSSGGCIRDGKYCVLRS
jgi:hypothetical protein